MQLTVNAREITGSKVKNLRKQGFLPASVYGPEIKPVNISLNDKEFKKVFKEAGYSSLIDLELTGKKVKALVKEVQYDPIEEQYLHVSLYQVNMNKPITTEVPITVSGESLAVKNNIGILVSPISTVLVKCLPANLPSHLEISISKLDKIGESIQISDIKLPEGVELDSDESAESVVAYISAPQKSIVEEEAEEAAAAAAAAEAAGIVPLEGEVPAEGEEGKDGAPAAEGGAKGPQAAKGAKPEADAKAAKPELKPKK
jgi:large subunit ribosomal protein L25